MTLSARKKGYLRLMGIPIYSERVDIFEETVVDETPLNVTPVVDTQPETIASVIESSSVLNQAPKAKLQVEEHEVSIHDVLKRSELPEDWSDLIDHVAYCTRCGLHESRTQTVFGVGDIQADWMIIGEAPGPEEDKQGEPFLGRSGKMLSSILESIGLAREKVYIANSLKCSPPGNRDAKKSELAQCRAYLEQQIALVDPKLILCVGRVASQNLLQLDEPISRMRGKVHSVKNPIKVEKTIPVIVTYHPAYLLRSPSQKQKVWDDLKLAFSVFSI